ncbi:PDC sensor domain-containing protein [Dyadobacter arcticus]|uniref:Cache domain-containing protein n=1 Tax=Dyadobacter arcticus TaxID=1078754 RepID=A0ABX0UNG7_9BACT|nr:cache domain-containing protein [Dyadobacter arcticus]NIJ54417.1 hypothetical protein [Dyadobacter arcticus]
MEFPNLSGLFVVKRKHRAVIFSILLVLFSGVTYVFVYIPENQRNLEQLRFRSLQTIDNNVHSKIDNSVVLLNQLLETFKNQRPEYNYNKDTLREYIRTYPNDKFKVSQVDSMPATSEVLKTDSLSSTIFSNNEITVMLQKNQHVISLKYYLNRFIEPLLPAEIFDQYLLLDSAGRVLYQTFPSGVTELNRDSLQGHNDAFLHRELGELRLGGSDYRFFTQRLSIDKMHQIMILGLLKTENYQQLKTQLPETLVLLLAIIGIAIIVTMPWVKLFHLGNRERLTTTDGILCFLPAVILMSILAYGFVKYNEFLRPDSEYPQTMKKTLADGIEKTFISEVNNAYAIVHEMDKLSLTYKYNAVDIGASPDSLDSKSASDSVRSLRKIRLLSEKLKISQVFWLNHKGDEVLNWTAGRKNAPSANYAARGYFRQLVDKRPYYLNDNKAKTFSLEQVTSWTSGRFTSVLSIPSCKENIYTSISFRLEKLSGKLVPAGFSYCIIDKTGKVLYHDNQSKNLNENLINEFSENEKLSNAIISENEKFFVTKYFGKEYRVFIRSMKTIPYHIVIFEDTSIHNSIELKIITFILYMLVGLSIFLALVFMIALSTNSSFWINGTFDFTRFGPKKEYHYQYCLNIIWNLFSIAYLVVLYNYTSILQFLLILFVTISFNIIFENYRLFVWRNMLGDSLSLIRVRIFFILFLAVVALNIVALIKTENKMPWIFQLWVFLFGLLSTFLLYLLPNNNSKKIFNQYGFEKSFSLMVFTRLIIIIGIPVAAFYVSVYNNENMLLSRFRQSSFIAENISKINTQSSEVEFNGAVPDGVWINKVSHSSNSSYKPTWDKESENKLIGYLTGGIISSDYQNPKGFKYNNFEGGKSETFFSDSKAGKLSLLSLPLGYSFPNFVAGSANSPYHAFYWLMVALALGILWYTFHKVLLKLFGLDILLDQTTNDFDGIFKKDDGRNLFVISQPSIIAGEGTVNEICRLITKGVIKGKDNRHLHIDCPDKSFKPYHFTDMSLAPTSDENPEKNKRWQDQLSTIFGEFKPFIILANFENNISNSYSNQLKFDLIENLVTNDRSRIIVNSAINPYQFFESLSTGSSGALDATTGSEQVLARWSSSQRHFKIVFKNMNAIKDSAGATPDSSEQNSSRITNNHAFSQSIRRPVQDSRSKSKYDKNIKIDSDTYNLTESLPDSHFQNLWMYLTSEEKFLLYDLAEDGLVNTHDSRNLSILISKGLMVQTESGIKLFNDRFRNFVLADIGNADAVKIRKQISENGTWVQLRTLLIIILITSFAIVFASNQKVYSASLSYITAISGAVAAVIQFFSLFKASGK